MFALGYHARNKSLSADDIVRPIGSNGVLILHAAEFPFETVSLDATKQVMGDIHSLVTESPNFRLSSCASVCLTGALPAMILQSQNKIPA